MVGQETHSWAAALVLVVPLLLLLLPSVAAQCTMLVHDTVFLNNLTNMKDRHCYKCYQVPAPSLIQVQLHQVRLRNVSSIMIYMGEESTHISQDCGDCEERTACHECKEIRAFNMFEMYLRQDKSLELDGDENPCQYIASFNMTLDVVSEESEVVTQPYCDGGFMVNFPQSGDSCIVNTTHSGLETHCLIPTCSEGMLPSDGPVEKVDYTFKTSQPETCLWKLNTEQRKHLTLTFSQDIRPHLTVFEGSLANPRWDMEWCPAYSNDYKLETEANTVFVVYHNTNPLSKKGSLTVTSQAAVCLIPPSLEYGNVEFKRLDSGMVAIYSCDHGYTLIGPPKVRCKDGAWSDPPVCVHDKDKLMSDAPMDSVESVDSANVTDLAPENETNLSPGDDSEQQVKLATPEEVAEEAIEMAEEEEKEREAKEMESITSQPDIEGETEYYVIEEEGEGDGKEEVGLELEEINASPATDTEWDDEDYSSNNTLDDMYEEPRHNTTRTTGTGGILSDLLNLNLEEDLKLYVIIAGAGLVALILIIIISVVVYRKRYPMRLGLGRRFDTFQNPIYEKAVVRVPLQVEPPPLEEKKAGDSEEVSNCTVLEP